MLFRSVSLYESKSGERGLFSREACQKIAKRNGRRNVDQLFGTNPCSEIILRPYGFCNLTEVVIRATDTIEQIKEKIEVATIIGTFQSTLTDFPYLRKIGLRTPKKKDYLVYHSPASMTPSCLIIRKIKASKNAWLLSVTMQ